MEVISFVVGVVVGGVGMYLVARNNKKKFMKAMGYDAKKAFNDVVDDIKRRLE